MKSFFVYFCVILLSLGVVPLAVAKSPYETAIPDLTVFENGEITKIDAEEYTLRVLLAEGSICESIEAKKALAVAARSCALYFSLYGCKHESFDVCTDKDCCIPLGSRENASGEQLAAAESATNETRGMILTSNGLPSLALFTHCAGSGTQQSEDFAYLSPTAENSKCDIHIFTKTVAAQGFLESISEENTALVYDEGGNCVFGVFNGRAMDGASIANALSLPGTEFTLTIAEGGIEAVCNGVGHGYGLNLCGAQRLAEGNMPFDEIINIYFPKLVLNKIY